MVIPIVTIEATVVPITAIVVTTAILVTAIVVAIVRVPMISGARRIANIRRVPEALARHRGRTGKQGNQKNSNSSAFHTASSKALHSDSTWRQYSAGVLSGS
jgi:hypothetical protein